MPSGGWGGLGARAPVAAASTGGDSAAATRTSPTANVMGRQARQARPLRRSRASTLTGYHGPRRTEAQCRTALRLFELRAALGAQARPRSMRFQYIQGRP